MQTLAQATGAMLTLAAAVALMPSSAIAQAPTPTATSDVACTAEVSPAQVETGSEAVQVTVTFSEKIGTVTQLESDGITLASPMDVPRAPMAAEDQPRTPIHMGADETRWTFWLNTAEAEEGTHTLHFVAGSQRCEAELEVVVPTG